MKNLTKALAFCAVAFLCTVNAGGASAQIHTEKSVFSLTEPMDVGGTLLQPGTYRIKVVQLTGNRNVVQVTNEAGSKVFAAVLATPHPIKTDETIPESRFVYFPAAEGQPKALRTWFAHDTPHGQDIIYPKRRAMEIAVAAKVPVIAIEDEVKEAEYKSVALTVVTPDKTVTAYVPPPYVAPAPAVAEARPHNKLPRTGSSLPLLAALGMLSLGGAVALRGLTNRS